MDVFSHPETDLRNVKIHFDFVYFGAYGWKNLELKIFFPFSFGCEGDRRLSAHLASGCC